MSNQDLHDFLTQLKEQRKGSGIVDTEYQNRLDEIVESLEQQVLYPDTFDQYSALAEQISGLMVDFEAEHPVIGSLLSGIHRLLNNFRT
ncbi:MAG: hypothetical protein ACJAYF_003005 [Arenicella sp.]|jgi:hypothetical protein